MISVNSTGIIGNHYNNITGNDISNEISKASSDNAVIKAHEKERQMGICYDEDGGKQRATGVSDVQILIENIPLQSSSLAIWKL